MEMFSTQNVNWASYIISLIATIISVVSTFIAGTLLHFKYYIGNLKIK